MTGGSPKDVRAASIDVRGLSHRAGGEDSNDATALQRRRYVVGVDIAVGYEARLVV
jgi:hypothetical protein